MKRKGVWGGISANSFANMHHPPKMIGFVFFHHLASSPFRIISTLKFLKVEGDIVVGAIVDSENLIPRATFIGVDKDDCGHGRHHFAE
jgi:hypothetical protein